MSTREKQPPGDNQQQGIPIAIRPWEENVYRYPGPAGRMRTITSTLGGILNELEAHAATYEGTGIDRNTLVEMTMGANNPTAGDQFDDFINSPTTIFTLRRAGKKITPNKEFTENGEERIVYCVENVRRDENKPPRRTFQQLPEFGDSIHRWEPSYTSPLEVALPRDLRGRTDVIDCFDRIMYGLGAQDTKAPILLHGISPEPRSKQQIWEQLERTFPEGTLSRPPNTSFTRSLCPTGIIIEDCGRYATSAAGEGFVKDIAALFIQYADTSKRPLSQTLGRTSMGMLGTRSYINRAAILLLLMNGDTYVSKVEQEIGLDKARIGKHFAALHGLGLAKYDFANTEVEGWGTYELIADLQHVNHSSEHDRLRRNIVAYFGVNNMGNPQTIAKALAKLYL